MFSALLAFADAAIPPGTDVATWVQTGGLLAFASLVYAELRLVRTSIVELQESITRLEERTRGLVPPGGGSP